MQDVERILRITANVASGKVTAEEGDHFFFLGDNNKIIVTLEDATERMYVSISANALVSTYIAELSYNEETNEYLLDAEDFNCILSEVCDKIRLNVHISNAAGERITTLYIKIESKFGFDDEATIVTPTTAKTLEDFYVALDMMQDLDVEKLKEATEIINGLDTKIEELDTALTSSKEVNAEVKQTMEDLNTKLENGEFNGQDGKDGQDGYTPIKGTDYFTESEIKSIEDNVYASLETNILGDLGAILDDINGEVI